MFQNRRILLIDDNPAIHNDFRKILDAGGADLSSLQEKEAILFGDADGAAPDVQFEVDSAYQGEEGLEMIMQSREKGQPYALAFLDVRMPPGWDGAETIEHIWPVDPAIQIVVCSAYSDYSFRDILMRVGMSNRLLMLRKPCDAGEILAMSMTLCEKWNLARFKAISMQALHPETGTY